jgi:hypothetical protein
MAGAVTTELFLVAKGGPELPAGLLVACLVVAFFRRDTIIALAKSLRPSVSASS